LLATRKYRITIANTSAAKTTFEYDIAPSHRRMVRRAILYWYDIEELDIATDESCPLAEMVSLEHVEVHCVHDGVTFGMLAKMCDRLKEWTGKSGLELKFEYYGSMSVIW
jgi:hypothetical protein